MFMVFGKYQGAANGSKGEIDIQIEAGSDRISGKAFGHPINGRWQAATGNLSFATTDGTNQLYKGQLVFPHVTVPETGIYTIAGVYDDISGTYGWFGQQSIVA